MSAQQFTRIWILPVIVLMLACSTLTPKPVHTEAEIEKEEQAIYSFFVGNGTGPVLLLQNTETDISQDDPQQTIDYVKLGLPGISRQTIDNYLERNASPSQLAPDMDLGVKYILLTTDELASISSQPNWGELLSEKYPGTRGYTIFSHVGFNSSLDQAMIYVGSVGGPMMGSGSYFLMEKKDGQWILKGQINVWIS